MKITLCGTRSFGVAVYDRLLEDGHDIVGVVAPGGDKLARRAAKRRWTDHINERFVAEGGTDLIVNAHGHAYIGSRSRAASRYGAIGYHPSLLPRHRGRDAVRWTIKMGDPVAGGSVYWFTNNIDAGPIARQDWLHVKNGWDHHDLWAELFPMGVRLLSETCAEVADGILRQTPQDEAVATWEPSWERPPVHRPELIALGSGLNGATIVAAKAVN